MGVVQHHRFVRGEVSPGERVELARVDALAAQLVNHLDSSSDAIDLVHIHRAASKVVQDIVAELLTDELGFSPEVVLTPDKGFVTRARPDFVYSLGPGRGVIAEVERGGTTTNNHDLKDLWKTHIASDVQHLFLVVPNANWNEAGGPREHPYGRVLTRLSSFFGDPRREVDVLSVHLFGYGRPF
ncbi:hypothetical protein ACTHAM_000728 [Cellulomonas soli]|uniref:hypothetical protein n=1 Tax=Cellulomonas soli TaxID=931535 RepID=UPI003F832B51